MSAFILTSCTCNNVLLYFQRVLEDISASTLYRQHLYKQDSETPDGHDNAGAISWTVVALTWSPDKPDRKCCYVPGQARQEMLLCARTYLIYIQGDLPLIALYIYYLKWQSLEFVIWQVWNAKITVSTENKPRLYCFIAWPKQSKLQMPLI